MKVIAALASVLPVSAPASAADLTGDWEFVLRAFNDNSYEFLRSSGIGNSLTEARPLATTQLVNWLQCDYKLEPNEAAVVFGTAMRYDIAEVVDPLIHVVAKIRKDAVAPLT